MIDTIHHHPFLAGQRKMYKIAATLAQLPIPIAKKSLPDFLF